MGVQADVVSGVEQFDQRTAGDSAQIRLSGLTVEPQQREQQRPDQSVDGATYLHLCVSVVLILR